MYFDLWRVRSLMSHTSLYACSAWVTGSPYLHTPWFICAFIESIPEISPNIFLRKIFQLYLRIFKKVYPSNALNCSQFEIYSMAPFKGLFTKLQTLLRTSAQTIYKGYIGWQKFQLSTFIRFIPFSLMNVKTWINVKTLVNNTISLVYWGAFLKKVILNLNILRNVFKLNLQVFQDVWKTSWWFTFVELIREKFINLWGHRWEGKTQYFTIGKFMAMHKLNIRKIHIIKISLPSTDIQISRSSGNT